MTLPLLSRRTNLRAKTERSAKQMPCALPMVASAGSSTTSLRHRREPRALKSQMPPLRRSMVMVSSSVRPCRVKTRAPVSDKSVMMPSLATALPSNMRIRTGLAGRSEESFSTPRVSGRLWPQRRLVLASQLQFANHRDPGLHTSSTSRVSGDRLGEYFVRDFDENVKVFSALLLLRRDEALELCEPVEDDTDVSEARREVLDHEEPVSI